MAGSGVLAEERVTEATVVPGGETLIGQAHRTVTDPQRPAMPRALMHLQRNDSHARQATASAYLNSGATGPLPNARQHSMNPFAKSFGRASIQRWICEREKNAPHSISAGGRRKGPLCSAR